MLVNKLRDYTFPVLMCLLTVATAAMYGHIANFGREYSFVVRTDEAGVSKMKSDLAGADLLDFEAGEVEDGIYRITVKCPRGKVGAMMRVMESFSEWRTKK